MIRKRINQPLPNSNPDVSDITDNDSMTISDDVMQAGNISIPVPNMAPSFLPAISPPEPVIALLSVPAKNILNCTDVKRLKNFRVIRRNAKQQMLKQEYITQVSSVLSLFNKNDNEYETEIVSFCCSVAEEFFISHSKMGIIKEESVVNVCKHYFNDDEKLVKTIIALVLPSVPKSNILRRNRQRIINFFFGLCERFFSA